ncbi:dynein regulatory complex subunit 7 [Pungitius pungitius]|uniref:dynein regulatory complex subunit 7 n=1 Tax=Pungitius pungitius TaxID=134920 RepID=UPI002E0EC329
MEAVQESVGQEELSSVETPTKEEEEDEGPRCASAAHELLLTLDDPDKLCPESYRQNSPNEVRLMVVADNFQRQFSHLCPDRKPLLLCPTNEWGVKKFVSTTLRPTATDHPELFTWQGCASFVADFLSLEPLEPPENLPRSLFSSTLVLQSQRATCLESSTLLCSLLLGANYDAYCVSGYASKDACLLDRSLLRCPLLGALPKGGTSEQEPLENKYLVKAAKELRSRFVTQQEEKKKKREAEAAMMEEQQEGERRVADPLWGLRVHCWVLVLSGSRDVPQNFFIDPLTGESHAPDDQRFLGVESAWNHLNYYVNMQDCSSGCADMAFDLEDLSRWEPLLYGALSRKQLALCISRRKEREMMSRLLKEEKQEQEQAEEGGVLEMPRSWVSYINISKEDLETRWPGRQKTTHYRKAKLEHFAPYLNPDGLVRRLTTYKDLACTEEVTVKSWYQQRDDHLEETEVNKVDNSTTERFTCGRSFYLSLHRFWSRSEEHDMRFSSDTRIDGLARRTLSPLEMTETFEGRKDFLFHRHTVFLQDLPLSTPDSDEEVEKDQLQEVLERFHRNRSKPAHADVAQRLFLLAEGRIEVTYHLEDHRCVASRRSFIKPLGSTERRKAEDFRADMVSSFQVDASKEPLKNLTLSQMLDDLMEEEGKVALQINMSRMEVADILACRETEKQRVCLPFSPWTTGGAAKARSKRQEMERQAEEERRWLQERKKDILAPLLIRLGDPEALSAEDARRLYLECLAESKCRLVEKAELIQQRIEQETQELQRKQQWYQKNPFGMTSLKREDYKKYCAEKTLRIGVAKRRLSMHMKAAPLEHQNVDQRLRNDPRLAPHLLT